MHTMGMGCSTQHIWGGHFLELRDLRHVFSINQTMGSLSMSVAYRISPEQIKFNGGGWKKMKIACNRVRLIIRVENNFCDLCLNEFSSIWLKL